MLVREASVAKLGPPSRLDRFISWLSPALGNKRRIAKFQSKQFETFSGGYRRPRHGERTSTIRSIPGGSGDFYQEQMYDREDHIYSARDLERKNPLAYSLICRDGENVIGSGHIPKAATASDAWNKQADALFGEWADDPLLCDVQGTNCFNTMQKMAWQTARRDGDIGAIKLKNGMLQHVEADYIATPIGEEANPLFVGGVEINRWRRPRRFHVVKFDYQDPKRFAGYPRNMPGRTVYKAEDFLFFAHRTRFTQVRGTPGFVRSASYFDQLDGYIEASVMAARMAAIFGLVVKLGPQTSGFDPSAGKKAKGSDGDDYSEWHLEPAMTKVLNFGDEIEQIKAEHPTSNMSDLVRMIVRFVGLEWGMPLEVALFDFTQSNYSNTRAALLQAYLAWSCAEKRWQAEYLAPIWRWKIDGFIRAGKLDYREDRYSHNWMGVGRGWIDPMKEVMADLIALDSGFTSLSLILRKRGIDLDELIRQRKTEIERFDDAEIPIMHSKNTREDERGQDPEEDAPEDAGDDPDEDEGEDTPEDEDAPEDDEDTEDEE